MDIRLPYLTPTELSQALDDAAISETLHASSRDDTAPTEAGAVWCLETTLTGNNRLSSLRHTSHFLKKRLSEPPSTQRLGRLASFIASVRLLTFATVSCD